MSAPRSALCALLALYGGLAAASEPGVPAPSQPPVDEPALAPRWRLELPEVRDVLSLPGRARLIARTPTDLRLLDAERGVELGVLTIDAAALRLSGDHALWVCGAGGVARVPILDQGFGAPVALSSEPCRALVVVPGGAGCERIVATLAASLLALPDTCAPAVAGADREPAAPSVEPGAPSVEPGAPSVEPGAPSATASLAVPESAPSAIGSSPGGGATATYVRPSTSPRERIDHARELGLETGQLRRAVMLESCAGSIGVAGSVSWVNVAWRTLGASWLASGSPTVGGSCAFRASGNLGWIVGIETSPWLEHTVDSVLYRSGLLVFGAVGMSTDQAFVGAHVSGGFTIGALGPIARYQPFTFRSGARHGIEARLNWVPARSFIGQLQASYIFEFGGRRPALSAP